MKEPKKLTGDTLEIIKPDKLLNEFWDSKNLDLKNNEFIKIISTDTLEILGSSLKFLCDHIRPKNDGNQKSEGVGTKILSKTLSLSKMEPSPKKINKKESKSKIEIKSSKTLSRKESKPDITSPYMEELGNSSIICYTELARRCQAQYKEFFEARKEHLYNTAKYLAYIGEFNEKYYDEALSYLKDCTMLSNYVDENYTKELTWINFLKNNKL